MTPREWRSVRALGAARDSRRRCVASMRRTGCAKRACEKMRSRHMRPLPPRFFAFSDVAPDAYTWRFWPRHGPRLVCAPCQPAGSAGEGCFRGARESCPEVSIATSRFNSQSWRPPCSAGVWARTVIGVAQNSVSAKNSDLRRCAGGRQNDASRRDVQRGARRSVGSFVLAVEPSTLARWLFWACPFDS